MARRLSPERVRKILDGLRRAQPEAHCALEHRTPFELLVATILSAQCTDKRVNLVTPGLFRRFPTPAALAAAPRAELERLVRPTGFFRAKARSLQEMSLGLMERHGGEVPRSLEELVALQGVGRKTANVLLGTAFGTASGVVVDTHVRRVTQRLGLTRHTDPVKIERDLMASLPQDEWVGFSHRVIWHGRQTCKAGRPRCGECLLSSWCPAGERELSRRRNIPAEAGSPTSRKRKNRY
jgi:endonuclease-3